MCSCKAPPIQYSAISNLFRAQIDALLRRLQSGDLDVASDCLELQSEITDNFASPLHWLHPKVLTLINSAFASLARMDMKEGMPPTDPDVAENLRMARYAELQEVLNGFMTPSPSGETVQKIFFLPLTMRAYMMSLLSIR